MIARECPKTGRGGSTPPEWQERVADILAHGVDAVDIYFDSREIREEMLAGDRCERGSERAAGTCSMSSGLADCRISE
jgi:hypothetical protein